MKYQTSNLEEFNSVAEKFVINLKDIKSQHGARVFGLYGDLGAGKTHFVKACAKALGIKQKISSPTFVIIKRYKLPDNKQSKYKNMYHLDAYRIKSKNELLSLGWNEMVLNKENIIFIEWPENVEEIMPKKHTQIKFSHLDGEKREITIV